MAARPVSLAARRTYRLARRTRPCRIAAERRAAARHGKSKTACRTDKATLQGFAHDSTEPGSTVYTDEHSGYSGMLRKHETVKHSVSEFVNGMAHTNGIESFWALLKYAELTGRD